MGNSLKSPLLFVLCWLFAPSIEAHDTIFVNQHFDLAAIVSDCDWTYDASRQLKPYQFANKDLQWQAHDADFFNIQNEGRYWLRFSVYNQDSIPLYLHLVSTSLDVYRLQLYVVSPSGIDSSIVTGSDFPASARPLQNSDLGFRLLFYPQQYYTCYLYLERDATPAQTSLLFYNVFSRANTHFGRIHRYHIGFTVGVAALYGIIAVLILFFFPQTLHVGYVLYTLGGLGYLTASLGMGIDILWSEYPYFGAFSEVFFCNACRYGITYDVAGGTTNPDSLQIHQ
ncbi:MAG: hypothetical protein IPH16_01440 [Haliscomenobacter sp.]|nr:hypothetical protein [Haliscomenobacter sp.]